MMPLAIIGLLVIGGIIGAGVFYILNNVTIKGKDDESA